MPFITRLLTTFVLLYLSMDARAEKLRIVTEPWAPYVYEENGQVLGLDYETTAIVFKRLGIDVQWQLLPWKRCLAMLEQGLADGALDIFHSNERDAMLLYPSEPLSDVEFVMFYANARPHPFRTLDDLGGLTVGTSPGYLYSQAFSESTLFDRVRKMGVDIPVVPGIMPITNYSKLARFSDACGAEIPRWIRKQLEAYGDDTSSIQSFGEQVITQMCERLLQGGAPGLHFYTLNQAEPSLAVWNNLKLPR